MSVRNKKTAIVKSAASRTAKLAFRKKLFIFGREVPASAIVLPKLTLPKKRRTKKSARTLDANPINDECACLPPAGLNDGQWIQYDGNAIFVQVPTTGAGPWALAQYSNGQPVWVNLGGL